MEPSEPPLDLLTTGLKISIAILFQMCVMSIWKEMERHVCEHALFWRVSQRNEKTDKVLYVEQTVAEKSNVHDISNKLLGFSIFAFLITMHAQSFPMDCFGVSHTTVRRHDIDISYT